MNDPIVTDKKDEDEQRHRRSQRSRSHPVTLQPCPECGTPLAASVVASIKRGEATCPRAWKRATR